MVAKVLDSQLAARLIAERQAQGTDKYDEVWDGVYVISPLADDEHQKLTGFFQTVLSILWQFTGRGEVRPGINLTDRPENWTKSYRVPDVAVFLPEGAGVCHGSFWTGGPDFAVEIVSEGEDATAKFEFYGRLKTRELLLVHRDPWKLELYEAAENFMHLVQTAEVNRPGLYSQAVELTFLLKGETAESESIELVIEHADGRTWSI